MTAVGTSIVDEVDLLVQERSLLKHRAIAFGETARRCPGALRAFLDGVYDSSITLGATG